MTRVETTVEPAIDAAQLVFRHADVARFCQVRPSTVVSWVKAGKIMHFRTPGGHARFRRGDIVRFLNGRGLPIPVDLRR